MLALIARVFQRDPAWFLDQNAEIAPARRHAGAPAARPDAARTLVSVLEGPAAGGDSGAAVADRDHGTPVRASADPLAPGDVAQRIPDLERTAERSASARFRSRVEDLIAAVQGAMASRSAGSSASRVLARDKDREVRSMVRSFFEPPGTVYLNKALQADPARLKFDLASHIGHKVLHGGDGLKSAHATGGEMGGSPEAGAAVQPASTPRTYCTRGAISSAASSPARCCARRCRSGAS